MIRKCLAALRKNCSCKSPCVACGTKRYVINTDCELCLGCEEDKLGYNPIEESDLELNIIVVGSDEKKMYI